MLRPYVRGNPTPRDEVTFSQVAGYIGLERIGSVPVAVTHDDLVVREQHRATAIMQLDPVMHTEVAYPCEYKVSWLGPCLVGERARHRLGPDVAGRERGLRAPEPMGVTTGKLMKSSSSILRSA
jgi:hypothetical protein